MLYFGYGSNLCEADLARFIADRKIHPIELERVDHAFLPDRRLAFTHRSTSRDGGVLDVLPSRGATVAGVLFRVLSDATLASLDRKEGEGHVYVRFETVALKDRGTEQRAFAYEVAPAHREPFVRPATSYLDVVRLGYEENRLDPSDLEAAAAGGSPTGPVSGLFVYGTLRRGEERHPVLLRHAVRGGETAKAHGTLLHLGSYPGLIIDGPTSPVTGELYTAPDPDALFAELDAIEMFRGFGAPGSVYRRAIVRVRTADRGVSLAWTYVYNGPRSGSRVVASGDWRDVQRP